MKTQTKLAVLAVVAGLAGCATTKEGCDTRDAERRQYCHSVLDTYQAARAGAGRAGKDFSVHDHSAGAADGPQQPIWAPGRMVHGEAVSGKNALGGPVFTPARPFRVWVAPWTDTNGTLHSGEYLYFVNPGHWNYGELTAPGSAGDVITPLRRDDLGFRPNLDRVDENGPVAPDLGLVPRN